jgi:phospho-N-acetylmuramoyl-pentapeptide-transferase
MLFSPFWQALVVSGVLAAPCLFMLRAMKSKSIISPYAPDGHQSKAGTPNMGGLFVLAGVAFALYKSGSPAYIYWVLGAFAFIGFLDDYLVPKLTQKRGLGWLPKLALEIGAASLVLLESPDLLHGAKVAFFLLFFANAVNFADGLDGLVGALLIISMAAFAVFGEIGAGRGTPLVGVLSLAVIGGIVPFLLLNAPPAKVFLGDVGALPLGAAYGLVFANSPWATEPWPWVLSLVFIVELILVPIQILAVKTIKRRVFPATPIHHAFEKLGWPESRVVWTFALAQFVLSMAAISEVTRWMNG